MNKLLEFMIMLSAAQTVFSAELIELDAQQRDNLGIKTSVVMSSSGSRSMSLPAMTVVPNDQLHIINSQHAGLIKQLYVVEGDPVSKRQDLVRIQSSVFLELQRDYLQLFSKFNLSRISYERAQTAFKEGVLSEEKMLGMQSEYYELAAARDQKREELKLSGISQEEINTLEKTKTLVSDFIIRSPIDGVILEQLVSAGERIDAATAIYKVGKLNPLWVEIHVPLTALKNTKTGNAIYIPEYNIDGKIITIGKQVHTADQGILVRAVVDEGAEMLRPGQFVQVKIMTDDNSDSTFLEIDNNAIVHTQNKSYVFVEKPGGFLPVEITVISHSGQNTVVSGDIQPDTNIAITGTAALKAIMTGMGGEG